MGLSGRPAASGAAQIRIGEPHRQPVSTRRPAEAEEDTLDTDQPAVYQRLGLEWGRPSRRRTHLPFRATHSHIHTGATCEYCARSPIADTHKTSSGLMIQPGVGPLHCVQMVLPSHPDSLPEQQLYSYGFKEKNNDRVLTVRHRRNAAVMPLWCRCDAAVIPL